MFENVQFFSHLYFKIAKSAIMTQKIFFLKNINMAINMGIKKARAKKLCEFWVFSFLCIFSCFLLLTFVRDISESRHQQIWIQHKILRFLIPILIFFKKKNFWVIIALFAILKCKCEKNCTFSNILQKVKNNFFANIYHSPCDSYWNSKKSVKWRPLLYLCDIRTPLRRPGWQRRG